MNLECKKNYCPLDYFMIWLFIRILSLQDIIKLILKGEGVVNLGWMIAPEYC